MSLSEHVLFVSAGMMHPKKRDHRLARRQLYLNYGALTLASLLEMSGVPAALVHGAHESPKAFLNRLKTGGLVPSQRPIMLSLPSFYALSWAQEFCRSLKAEYPKSTIIAGGRWVTNPDPAWLRHRIPELDVVVTGFGEQVIGHLAGFIGATMTEFARSELPDFPLNHRLINGFEAFQPSIETSRGCGMGCAFCEEREVPLSKLRDPSLLADFMNRTLDQYGGEEIRPYMQSSFFVPSSQWASRLREETQKRGLSIQWRCETRVDAMKPETVEHLAAAGLKVIDLGLETASPQQLSAMNKSANIDRYLKSASALLRACKANGVWVKVNVLLYAGETEHTVSETRAWLDQHADAIKGVSVGPVVVFGPPSQAMPLLKDLKERGARAVDPRSTDTRGITAIHLSTEIDAEAAEMISLNLSRRYMSQDDYFDLKGFSYYPRHYRRVDFDADVQASDKDSLPFVVPS